MRKVRVSTKESDEQTPVESSNWIEIHSTSEQKYPQPSAAHITTRQTHASSTALTWTNTAAAASGARRDTRLCLACRQAMSRSNIFTASFTIGSRNRAAWWVTNFRPACCVCARVCACVCVRVCVIKPTPTQVYQRVQRPRPQAHRNERRSQTQAPELRGEGGAQDCCTCAHMEQMHVRRR